MDHPVPPTSLEAAIDARFQAAMLAAWRGEVAKFEAILDRRPELVTDRSSCSHPTLLQFVVLDGGTGKIENAESMIRALVDRGARLDEPLVAAASIDARSFVDLLLTAGAPLEACSPWTPLEEAVYWAHRALALDLRRRGALVSSLRVAAGLGLVDLVEAYLSEDGLVEGAGPVRFPWGAPSAEPRDVLDQALVIAAKNDQGPTVRRLLEAGADPNAAPPGIHEGGGPLHHAAMHGRSDIVSILLEAGADPTLADAKYHSTAAGWAKHGGHTALGERLRIAETRGRRPR